MSALALYRAFSNAIYSMDVYVYLQEAIISIEAKRSKIPFVSNGNVLVAVSENYGDNTQQVGILGSPSLWVTEIR